MDYLAGNVQLVIAIFAEKKDCFRSLFISIYDCINQIVGDLLHTQ